jgi:hypothetical protein
MKKKKRRRKHMPRFASGSNLSINQLERILKARKTELQRLARRRGKLARQLAKIDAQMRGLGGEAGGAMGGGIGSGGGRARNEQSLVKTIEGVLGKTSKPMNVGDIATAVQRGGYRSNSANFRGIVNQTLIKEKQFAQASRGMYQLKK